MFAELTEYQWLNVNEPLQMLDFVLGRASERKLRLFCCACWRPLANTWVYSSLREVLDAAEAFAEGKAGRGRLKRIVAHRSGSDCEGIRWLAAKRATQAVRETVRCSALASSYLAGWGTHSDLWITARRRQAIYLREIFGNPFSVRAIQSRWLTSTVTFLAQVASEDRDYAVLPLLGDALEEAGCSDQAILQHCRGNGEHVRGCWVLDLILGKE
jgi:hypothetical protein